MVDVLDGVTQLDSTASPIWHDLLLSTVLIQWLRDLQHRQSTGDVYPHLQVGKSSARANSERRVISY